MVRKCGDGSEVGLDSAVVWWWGIRQKRENQGDSEASASERLGITSHQDCACPTKTLLTKTLGSFERGWLSLKLQRLMYLWVIQGKGCLGTVGSMGLRPSFLPSRTYASWEASEAIGQKVWNVMRAYRTGKSWSWGSSDWPQIWDVGAGWRVALWEDQIGSSCDHHLERGSGISDWEMAVEQRESSRWGWQHGADPWGLGSMCLGRKRPSVSTVPDPMSRGQRPL